MTANQAGANRTAHDVFDQIQVELHELPDHSARFIAESFAYIAEARFPGVLKEIVEREEQFERRYRASIEKRAEVSASLHII